MKKLILLLAFLLFSSPLFAQTGAKLMDQANGANTAVTATLAAPTVDGLFIYVTCYTMQINNTAASAVGTVTVTSTGLVDTISHNMERVVADNAETHYSECHSFPIKALLEKTAVTITGNSGNANTLLTLTIWGYQNR